MTRSLAITIALLIASHADAVPRNTVQAHIDRAMKAHKEGKFDVALDELQAAYTLDPRPDLLFAIAQVYVKLDRCTDAIAYYEKFSAVTKDPNAKQVVAQAIDACKAKLATARKPDPSPPPTDPKPTPEPSPPIEAKPEPRVATPPPDRKDDPFAPTRSERPTASPWYKDPLGDALVGGGVIAAIGGFVMWRGANSDIDKANATTDIASFRDLEDSARGKRVWSIVLAGASAGLVTLGVVRYMSRGKRERARVALVPSTDGGLVTMSGRF